MSVNIETVIADLDQALKDAQSLVPSTPVPVVSGTIPASGFYVDSKTGLAYYNGKICNGWNQGGYYIDGVKGSPFKSVNGVMEYDAGAGFLPFTGWGPGGQYDKGVLVKAPVTTTPPPSSSGGSTTSTPTSSGIPSTGFYLDKTTGLAYYNGAIANGWYTGGQYSGGHLVTPETPAGFYNLPPVVPGSMTTSNGISYTVVPESLKVLQAMENSLPKFHTLPMFPLSNGYLNKNAVWDGTGISVTGSANETLSVQLLLTPSGTSPVDVSVSLGGLPFSANLFQEWFSLNNWGPPNNQFSEPPWTGYMPEALIPFVDSDTGTVLVGSMTLTAGQMSAVWIDLPIPKGQTPGTFSGVITVTIGTASFHIPISVTVTSIALPDFNSDPSMLMAWGELYATRFIVANGLPWPLNAPGIALFQSYQKFMNAYCMDLQFDELDPVLTPDFTTNTCTVDWTSYDATMKPSLSGSLFPSGQPMRAVMAPIGEEWNMVQYGNWSYDSGPPPAGLMAMLTSYTKQIVAHWNASGYAADPFAYIWDEPQGKNGTWNVYATIVDYANAVNAGNDWKTRAVRFFVTCSPEPLPKDYGDQTGVYASSILELSTPAQGQQSWVLDWAPNATYYYAGPGTSTPDLSIEGIKKSSMAPRPIRSWFYQSGPPFVGNMQQNGEGIDLATYALAAFKYNVNGIFLWAVNFWGGYNGDASLKDPTLSPYLHTQDGIMVMPGTLLPTIGIKSIPGPVPTNKLAMWRRGYQDYMYLWLVQKKNLALAQTLIDGIMSSALDYGNFQPVYSDPDYNHAGKWSHNPDDYVTLRQACMKALGA